ncbi:uncharacterized protein SEPMUDRAFT_105959 [Sphaerulina musiva SO2202]|uniref:Uncharacterized protein n=1 Tax=Sphaerulina musiva (strain SO2202) TaxID=692275 RepID=M3DCH6_SPHMS|nr:uncharacterized protein SEPMUDRAFT_105959 [Sphaerulina musiva SO2202]EMF15745.1 hypothetical protein SEPMUDRAFT_105959 [Sphaerulina musiva SO2202]
MSIEPPSYEDINNEAYRAIPLIVQIHQHSPTNIIFEENPHHHQLIISTPPPSNRPLPTLLHKDAILLPTTSTYEEVFNLLYQRVLARSAGSFPPAVAGAAFKEGTLFCRLALLVDVDIVDNQQQQQILIDQGNWIAARTFLRFRENVELVFHFCFVPIYSSEMEEEEEEEEEEMEMGGWYGGENLFGGTEF